MCILDIKCLSDEWEIFSFHLCLACIFMSFNGIYQREINFDSQSCHLFKKMCLQCYYLRMLCLIQDHISYSFLLEILHFGFHILHLLKLDFYESWEVYMSTQFIDVKYISSYSCTWSWKSYFPHNCPCILSKISWLHTSWFVKLLSFPLTSSSTLISLLQCLNYCLF